MSETILVASFLEQDCVERIRANWDGEVLYEPRLVPQPQYAADHGGRRPDLDESDETEWRTMLAAAQISFDFDWWQPGHMLDNCPQLRWVQATSAGIGGYVARYGLDRESSGRDIVFTTAAGTHAVPLTEFALLGALYFVKGVPDLAERQRRHEWERYTTRSLAGRRVTVVGLGSIGRHCARTFAELGTRVTGIARPGGRRPDVPGVELVDTDSLDAVLVTTDILVLAAPLTPATHKILDARRLALLPDGAVVINIARGQLLDQDALIEELRAGRLAGAALDVTDPEPPPPDSPLWDLPTVLLSPHSASTLPGENALLVDLFVDNLQRRRDGRPLRNVYRPELGY